MSERRKGQRGPKPSPELAHRRRKAIFRAAASLFYERGITNTSMEDIANALGFTKGVLYHYFASKADILHALFLEVQRESTEAILSIRAENSSASDTLEQIIRYISRRIRDAEWKYAFVRAMEVLQHLPEHYARDVRQRARENQILIREVVMLGVLNGEFINLNPVILERIAIGATLDTARWYDPNGPVSQEEFESILVHVVMTGLRRPALGT